MKVNMKECRYQGVDPKRVQSAARRISRAMRDLKDMGLELFGGTWSATIRGDNSLILAEMNECRTSGGCGAQAEGRDGLIRGEV